jgi:ATP-dependent exoDNAse (exonuclease V) beta subunit
LAREVGTLVHLCVEERVEPDAARERAHRHKLDADQAEFVAACVAAERELPSHARAFAPGAQVHDELPVSWGGAELAAAGGGPDLLMHAFIDRLIRHADGSVEIVDFKTDRLDGPAETLDARLHAQAEHHMVQLALYGLALEAAGCRVTTLTLAFLAVGRDVSVPFDEPRRVAARAALAAYQAQLV